MCLESTVGITGVLIGAGFLGFGSNLPIVMDKGWWSVLVVLIFGTGFVIKDFVIEANPWRIIRDRNHMNIVFTCKKK